MDLIVNWKIGVQSIAFKENLPFLAIYIYVILTSDWSLTVHNLKDNYESPTHQMSAKSVYLTLSQFVCPLADMLLAV